MLVGARRMWPDKSERIKRQVPQPDGSDPTLDPVDFDRTAEILLSTGLPLLD